MGPEWLGAELVWGRIDLIPFKKRFLYFNILSIYNLATFAVSKMASYVFVWSKNRADIWDGNEHKIRKWLVLKFHGSGHLQIILHLNKITECLKMTTFKNVQNLFRISSTKTGLFRISWLCSVSFSRCIPIMQIRHILIKDHI